MKSILKIALRLPMTSKILAFLIGSDAGTRSKFESALQASSVMPMLVFVIGLRVKQRIKKLIGPLAGKSHRLLETKKKNDLGVVRIESAPQVALTPREGGLGPVLRLPTVSNRDSPPSVIFQTWKSKTSLPSNYAQWSESFKQLNPDFEYFLWDDFDNRRFIEIYYPWFLPVYDGYPREIFRVDAVRYFFLYQFGGLYVDMDTECLKPVAPLFESGDVWLGRMGTDIDVPHSVPNAIMASRPFQEFWLLAIHLLVENARTYGAMADNGPEAMTGPIVLKQAYDTYTSSDRSQVSEMIKNIASRLPNDLQPRPAHSRIKLLDPQVWYPIDWSNIIHYRLLCEISDSELMLGEQAKHWLFPKSFLVTYWTHSWKAPIQKQTENTG